MIEALSNRLAVRMKKINPDETASVEVMSFALQGILHNTITALTALVAAFLLGHFWETVLTIAFFMLLRTFSGGYHFKSALACFIVSASVFILIPLIEVSNTTLLVLNLISLVLVAIYAPSNIKEHIRFPEKFFPVFKILCIVLVSLNFFYLESLVTIAFFVQSCSLITLKRR